MTNGSSGADESASAERSGPATDVVAGRYALCDPLDSGGSGTVWRAWDLTRGTYCAAKLLRRREAGQLLRFVREQSVRLDGDHIASPYAWAAEDVDVLIAAELIDGGSLFQLVATYGALSEPTVAALLDQMLAGLEHVHAVGLVHRDVKPGNVLLRATGTGPLDAVLIDFGLAIRSGDARLTELGTVIGTPGYLPPELATEHAGPTPAQDLFAAGRTAMALLMAQEPKLGVRQEFPIVDPGLRQAVAALLVADPAHRPPSAAAARELLSRAIIDPVPRARDGRPITVASQLPPLPEGWDPVRGPESGSATTSLRAGVAGRSQPMTKVQVPEPAGAPVDPAGLAAGADGWAALAAAERVPQPAMPDPPPGLLVSPPRPPSRWPLAIGGLGVLLAIAAIVVAVVVRSHPPAPNDSDTTGTAGASSGAQSSSAVVANGPAVGDACSFVDEGLSRLGPDGPVVCALGDAGTYRWVTS